MLLGYTESLGCVPFFIIQEAFHFHLNTFEIVVKHLFLIISHYICNNEFTCLSLLSRNMQSPIGGLGDFCGYV